MKENPVKNPKRSTLSLIDKWVVLPVAVVLIPFIIYGFVEPESFAKAASAVFDFSVENFGAILLLGPFFLVVFCVGMMFTKWGNIRIGGENAKPEMSRFSWFSIALTTCIGIGLVYYGTYEPLNFVVNPPAFLGIEGSSPAAVESWGYVFMHWLITPYSLYTAGGLCLTMMVYHARRKGKYSSGMYPLFGKRVDGRLGSVIDAFVLLVTFGGLCASIGVAALQLTGGTGYVFGKDFSNKTAYLLVILLVTALCILTTSTGLKKGMMYLAKINVVLFFALLLGAFLLGHTVFQMDSMTNALGYYLDNFLKISLNTEPGYQTGWVGEWTVFFNAWYLVCTPVFGIFLVKLAKGRTIREFIAVNLIGPSIFIFLWFGIFGGEAIYIQTNGIADLGAILQEKGAEVATFALAEYLPLAGFFKIGGLIAVFLSFATCVQSQILAISDSSTVNGAEESSPVKLRIFWGIIAGAFGCAVLLAGGYDSLQTVLVALGPIALILMLLSAAGFIKSLVQREKYDLVLKEETAAKIVKAKDKSEI